MNCPICATEFEPTPGRGRPRQYCSERCRVTAHRRRKVLPIEMTSQPRWVRWKPYRREGRVTKLPLQTTGHLASSTDPNTWTTYRAALSSDIGTGLGFILGNGIGCIDLDHCIDDAGNISDLAASILNQCPPTFCEISQSGHGLHIFGLMPEAPGRRRNGIEIYSRARFIATTANRLRATPSTLADLTELHRELTA